MVQASLELCMALLCFRIFHVSDNKLQNGIYFLLGLSSLCYALAYLQGWQGELPLPLQIEHGIVWLMILLRVLTLSHRA
ncbi:MAG: hypothetical protein ACO1RX_08380 [Candidatus Sericytochromatia bacterium]